MKDWLDGFDHSWTRQGGSYVTGDYPWRLELHTTEGKSVAGALAAYESSGAYPHFTVRYETKERLQHVSLSRSSTASRNLDGGVETNRWRCIQVEIVGFAGESHTWSKEKLEWLGREVVAPIRAQVGFQLVAPKFVGTESGTIATTTAKQRMSFEAWKAFNGVCGHQHVPENHHWDPGRLDIATILAAAGGVASPAPSGAVSEEDEDVSAIFWMKDAAGADHGYLVSGNEGVHIASMDAVAWFKYIGAKEVMGVPNYVRDSLSLVNGPLQNAVGKRVEDWGHFLAAKADAIAQAVAKITTSAVDPAVIKAAVKAALKEGVG